MTGETGDARTAEQRPCPDCGSLARDRYVRWPRTATATGTAFDATVETS
jgi:hypothetical protein